jgi:hypothetical protein
MAGPGVETALTEAETALAEAEMAGPGVETALTEAETALAGAGTADLSAELRAAEEHITSVLTATLDRLGAAHHRPFSRG